MQFNATPEHKMILSFANTSNSFQLYSFICTQLNGFSKSKWLDSSIWSIDGTLMVLHIDLRPGQAVKIGNAPV